MQLEKYLNDKKYYDCESIESTPNYSFVRFEVYENGKIHHDHIIFDRNFEITYKTSDIFMMFCDSFRDLFTIEKNELWGVIDAFGNEIIPCHYSYIDIDTEGNSEPNEDTLILASNRPNKEDTLFTTKGKVVSKTYNHIDSCDYDGMFIVKQNKLYGLINKSGEEILIPQYTKLEYAYIPQEHIKYLIAENKNEKVGVIDPQGNTIIPFKYRKIEYLGHNSFVLITPRFKYKTVKI